MATSDETKTVNVSLTATLFEAGDPLVILLTKKAGKGTQHFVGCAIPDDIGHRFQYFVVYVAKNQLVKYFNEQRDLRFLFAFARERKYYCLQSLTPNKKGMLSLTEFCGDLSEDLLPDRGFFVTAHTTNYGIADVANGEQRLLIDGGWDMQEFGSFYQKFSDLYGYEKAIEYFTEDNESVRGKRVEKAFLSKPFKGGSSYIGFFDDLFDIIPLNMRPALDGIVYNSPGHVDLRGSDEILASIKSSVIEFLSNIEEIVEAHDKLRSFMSDARLLSITANVTLDNGSITGDLKRKSAEFFKVLPISGKDQLEKLTRNNPVVHAKIGLALFRRLRATSAFFAEGRLSYEQ